jgi:hypothetical protein
MPGWTIKINAWQPQSSGFVKTMTSTNPGLGDAGHYYYLHTFAKALDALGKETIEDHKGHQHFWRSDLIRELSRRQRRDGSWLNRNTRWLEGDPNLVCGYALLALSYCRSAE